MQKTGWKKTLIIGLMPFHAPKTYKVLIYDCQSQFTFITNLTIHIKFILLHCIHRFRRAYAHTYRCTCANTHWYQIIIGILTPHGIIQAGSCFLHFSLQFPLMHRVIHRSDPPGGSQEGLGVTIVRKLSTINTGSPDDTWSVPPVSVAPPVPAEGWKLFQLHQQFLSFLPFWRWRHFLSLLCVSPIPAVRSSTFSLVYPPDRDEFNFDPTWRQANVTRTWDFLLSSRLTYVENNLFKNYLLF